MTTQEDGWRTAPLFNAGSAASRNLRSEESTTTSPDATVGGTPTGREFPGNQPFQTTLLYEHSSMMRTDRPSLGVRQGRQRSIPVARSVAIHPVWVSIEFERSGKIEQPLKHM